MHMLDHHGHPHHAHHSHGHEQHGRQQQTLGHHHGPPPLRDGAVSPAFKWAALLNTLYLVGEAAAGFAFGSVALLADAAHNLSDVAGLLIAWAAAWAAQKQSTRRYNFGYGRATILAALANGGLVLAGAIAVIVEAALRLKSPTDIPALGVAGVALVGIAINAGSAFLFRNQRSDLNADGAYLHMMADAAVSGGVVLAALLAGATGWYWLDPLAAVIVSLLVAFAAWGLLRAGLHLAMDGVPPHVDRAGVDSLLAALPGVAVVEDLRIWPVSTTRSALAARLIMPAGHPGDAALAQAARALDQDFGIAPAFLQVTLGPAGGRQ